MEPHSMQPDDKAPPIPLRCEDCAALFTLHDGLAPADVPRCPACGEDYPQPDVIVGRAGSDGKAA